MRIRKKYTDINDTLRHIKRQIIDGLPYARATAPDMECPRDLWNYLKPKLIYKHDPPGVELLQTYKTLMCDNWHGKPGAGDCDCFTIATCTLAINCYFEDIRIILAGRDKIAPVHIWTEIKHNGKIYSLDFTEPKFDTEREYKYIQILPVPWMNWKY